MLTKRYCKQLREPRNSSSNKGVLNSYEKSRFNYQHCMELGKKGYTQEKFEQQKEFFGVYVLQSNAGMPAQEIFGSYKNAGVLKHSTST